VSTGSIIHDLPRKRTGKALSWIEQQTVSILAVLGLALYAGFTTAVSALEFGAQFAGSILVAEDASDKAISWWDIFYFNFITILTVGYGDFHPVSYGKALSIIEALIGVGLFGFIVSILTVKALLPPRNTIVFSRNAFYCTEPECFLIVFVNTTNRILANLSLSWYFKLEGDWVVRPAITAPLVTKSVQTFYLERVSQGDLINRLREGDCLRVGLSAAMGFSNFSTHVQYSTDNVLVIANRQDLIDFFEPRWDPDFGAPSFLKAFHYGCDASAPTLAASVEEARRSRSDTFYWQDA